MALCPLRILFLFFLLISIDLTPLIAWEIVEAVVRDGAGNVYVLYTRSESNELLPESDVILRRYGSDGSLDRSYGDQGEVSLSRLLPSHADLGSSLTGADLALIHKARGDGDSILLLGNIHRLNTSRRRGFGPPLVRKLSLPFLAKIAPEGRELETHFGSRLTPGLQVEVLFPGDSGRGARLALGPRRDFRVLTVDATGGALNQLDPSLVVNHFEFSGQRSKEAAVKEQNTGSRSIGNSFSQTHFDGEDEALEIHSFSPVRQEKAYFSGAIRHDFDTPDIVVMRQSPPAGHAQTPDPNGPFGWTLEPGRVKAPSRESIAFSSVVQPLAQRLTVIHGALDESLTTTAQAYDLVSGKRVDAPRSLPLAGKDFLLVREADRGFLAAGTSPDDKLNLRLVTLSDAGEISCADVLGALANLRRD
jgi:hypothetical protein